MVTAIWAAAAEVITMDGAEDTVIITAGHAADTITATELPGKRPPAGLSPVFAARQSDRALKTCSC
jgi:hypothetical protein